MTHLDRRQAAVGLLLFAVLASRALEPRDAAGSDDRKAAPASRPPVLLSSPTNPLVAFRVVLRTGSQDDPPGKEGLAALTAAMVAEGGTKSLTYDQILAAFYPIAVTLEGSCRNELTVFKGLVHRDNLRGFSSLATEMITQPRFAPEDFTRLRNEALDWVTKYLRGADDEELGKWTLQVELYKGHPYGHPSRGTVQGLQSITLDDVKEFHRRYYNLRALQLGLAGGFDPGAPARILKQFDTLPANGPEVPTLAAPSR